MSDKYRIVLSKEDFSPDECELIQQLASFQEDVTDPKAELHRCLNEYLIFQSSYVCASKKIRTILEILELDYRTRHEHRIIKAIDGRIKSVKSICAKLQKRGLPISLKSAGDNLTDIAGLRVICPYIRDIYEIRDRLLEQEDIRLIKMSNYIENPKPSGYRSLHLIISTSVHLADGVVNMPVEIQLRTVAMDSWAGLEHKLKYKNPCGVPDEISAQLSECAAVIAETDSKMQRIYESLFGSQDKNDKIL